MIFCLGCTVFFSLQRSLLTCPLKGPRWAPVAPGRSVAAARGKMCGWLEKMGIQIGHLSKCNIWNIHGTFKTQQSVPTSTNSFQRLSELSDWQNSDINFAMYPSYIHPESLRCQGHRNAKEARRMSDRTARLSR